MRLALPKPFPDENLRSVISRYCDALGVDPTWGNIQRMFGGRRSSVKAILPNGLDFLSEVTYPYWRKSGVQIARELTAFPYFSAFVEPAAAKAGLDVMLADVRTKDGKVARLPLCSALSKMGRGRGML